MPTFGCHNCKADLKAFEDRPYEEWPCAKCALAKNYSHTFCTGYFDTADLDGIEDESLVKAEDASFVTMGDVTLTENELATLGTIKDAIAHQIMSSLSGIVLTLLKMSQTNPTMFEILIKKMQFPFMSYSDIGASLDPPCSKQNVLYHLKSAVRLYPEIEAALLIDSRYSGGRYALKTLAESRRREQVERRVRQNLYGDAWEAQQYGRVEEINDILRLPFVIDPRVLDFNAYVKDEEELGDGK